MRRAVAGSARGFTLIELLVALSALGLIAFLSFDGLRFALRAWGSTVEHNEGLHDVTGAQRFLRSRLESLYVFEVPPGAQAGSSARYPLEGDERSLSFSAPLGHSTSTPGMQRFTLSPVARSRGGFDLEAKWHADRNGHADPQLQIPMRETLLEGVAGIEISYLENGGPTQRWVQSWRGRSDAPQLVRIRAAFPAGDARRWPELVAAPRITADANCAFDVVSQRCR